MILWTLAIANYVTRCWKLNRALKWLSVSATDPAAMFTAALKDSSRVVSSSVLVFARSLLRKLSLLKRMRYEQTWIRWQGSVAHFKAESAFYRECSKSQKLSVKLPSLGVDRWTFLNTKGLNFPGLIPVLDFLILSLWIAVHTIYSTCVNNH